jgi:hypothetical protein
VSAEIILHNAKIATNGVPSFVEAIAIAGGRITFNPGMAVRRPPSMTRVAGPRRRKMSSVRPVAYLASGLPSPTVYGRQSGSFGHQQDFL